MLFWLKLTLLKEQFVLLQERLFLQKKADLRIGLHNFEVNIDSINYAKRFTDEKAFCTYFIFYHFGVFKIEIQLEGFADSTYQITVKVNPKEVIETAETN